ncbi:MAG: COX15/CtaA family protein, partial [Candidatus Puniceispirillaceae bacterium]
SAQSSSGYDRALVSWLFGMVGLVAIMVVIGGVTRLTGSGLSMVEWRPFIGILPPLTEVEWMRVFKLYQASPEFQQVNIDMNLAEFKVIFFWEYVHRVWGRLLGLAFGLPLLFFWLAGRIPQGYGLPLLGLLALGSVQGIIGWWMVTSGLVDNPAVSQYRLAIHLSMALLILLLLLWTALNLRFGRSKRPSGRAAATLLLVALTIIAGAFVAGMDAGLLYNEYPLMGDGLVPVEYGENGLFDPFENPATAQFHHRWIAVLAVLAVADLWVSGLRKGLRGLVHIMAMSVIIQFLLGLTTLLLGVPVWAGALHQAGAVLLLSVVLIVTHRLQAQQ